MSDDRVRNMPGRGSIDDPVFQRCLKIWRQWAHRRGLVVGSPIRLIGAEKTLYGDSDNIVDGAKSYLLSAPPGIGASVGDLWLTDKEQELLAGIANELDDRAEIDIGTIRAPAGAILEELKDERDRWELTIEGRRIGIVVRVGEGAKKHYLLHLWIGGGWTLVSGQPCFDLPMFGLSDLRERDGGLPVMIHEGPKAWKAARGMERLAGWVHTAWHGSEWGMEWTDWTPLRGRRVLIWPDVDEAGMANARRLAVRIAQMGGIVEYVNWGVGDIAQHEGWDWADDGGFSSISEGEIKSRTQMVESPIGPDGKVLSSWARRSFLDYERREVYQVSRGFKPMPLDALSADKPKNFRRELFASEINPFVGVDYRPGIPMGRLPDGRVNICPPGPRDGLEASPFDKGRYREIRVWLRSMIPDLRERKHVIRRAAWAIARPERTPQHMIILQGNSSIGKSVLLNLIVAASGRGVSLMPDSIFGRFNGGVAYKSVVAIEEIHSNDMTRKQNAGRLKELIANKTIEIEEKNRPRVTMTNVVHWFAATNEKVPFALEHGNDRFYFVKCETPNNPQRMHRFFRKWVPRFSQEAFLDELSAGAKWLIQGLKKKVQYEMEGRASRQDVWGYMEQASIPAWEQFLKDKLETISEPDEKVNHPPVFFGGDIVRLVSKAFPRIGVEDIRRKMNDHGFVKIKREGHSKSPVQRTVLGGGREVVWCRGSDHDALVARGDFGSLKINTLRGE